MPVEGQPGFPQCHPMHRQCWRRWQRARRQQGRQPQCPSCRRQVGPAPPGAAPEAAAGGDDQPPEPPESDEWDLYRVLAGRVGSADQAGRHDAADLLELMVDRRMRRSMQAMVDRTDEVGVAGELVAALASRAIGNSARRLEPRAARAAAEAVVDEDDLALIETVEAVWPDPQAHQVVQALLPLVDFMGMIYAAPRYVWSRAYPPLPTPPPTAVDDARQVAPILVDRGAGRELVDALVWTGQGELMRRLVADPGHIRWWVLAAMEVVTVAVGHAHVGLRDLTAEEQAGLRRMAERALRGVDASDVLAGLVNGPVGAAAAALQRADLGQVRSRLLG